MTSSAWKNNKFFICIIIIRFSFTIITPNYTRKE